MHSSFPGPVASLTHSQKREGGKETKNRAHFQFERQKGKGEEWRKKKVGGRVGKQKKTFDVVKMGCAEKGPKISLHRERTPPAKKRANHTVLLVIPSWSRFQQRNNVQVPPSQFRSLACMHRRWRIPPS